MTVTADRLLVALWKNGDAGGDLLREVLALLSVERIALPWRRVSGLAGWERRDLTGGVVVECGQVESGSVWFRVVGPNGKKLYVEADAAGVKAAADDSLRKAGWVLVDLPSLGPWEATNRAGGEWVRRTSLGGVVAWVRPVRDTPRRFTTFVLLDEVEVPFEGTAEKAMSVVDRNLEHFGFPLG